LGVCRHHAKHFEPGLEKQVGDGPLVVDLVADIGRENPGVLASVFLSPTPTVEIRKTAA
jgi:hypothetical protein